MRYRQAAEGDVDLLAEMNHQLIRDERHRNPMTVPELAERMRGWLRGEYTAIIFEEEDGPVAYALYGRDPVSIYLRQFFVARDHRRRGIGRQAVGILLGEVWPRGARITVEVLTHNHTGHAFWRAMGFVEYSVALERTATG